MVTRWLPWVLLLAASAGCCPWAEWDPCLAEVNVQDAGGQPIDATVLLLKRPAREEFSRTECAGTCTVEVPDLFHNGEWSHQGGLILRAEAAGKEPLELTGTCENYGMNIDGQLEPGQILMQLADAP
jgi:hypothetical protein